MNQQRKSMSESEEKLPLIKKNESLTVAVVDDEPDILELVTLNLQRAGFKVKGFSEADSFFKYLKNQVLGLELGADDYITKPFSVRELVARVKVVLRRNVQEVKTKVIKIADLIAIDLQKYETFVNGEKIVLTSSEYKILVLLAKRKGWVYARDQILDHLGVHDKGVLDRTVDVHIKNLREKLGPAAELIKNITGVGYKLED
jgi:DNA-binding response OmpR family regulator